MNRYEEVERSIRYLRKMMIENKTKYYHYLLSEDEVAADRIDRVTTGIIMGMNELYSLLSPPDQDEVNLYDEREQELQDSLDDIYKKWLEVV